MKIEVEVDKIALESIVSFVLEDIYDFYSGDDDFEEQVKRAMTNEEFMKDIGDNIAAELSSNAVHSLYQYASDFTVKSAEDYGLK